jgi:predicted nuclease with TOPRIM domain
VQTENHTLLARTGRDAPMPKKLQSDDDDLMKIFEHYAELRRENAEYEDTVRTLECDIASLQGRVEQLEELNKQLTEERDQFLERYYRLVTQFELMGGSFDRARAGITDAIGYLRRRPEKHDHHEIPALPAAKSLGSGNGLEDGIAKIAAALEGERRQEEHENS